jgi:hypothetical protein
VGGKEVYCACHLSSQAHCNFSAYGGFESLLQLDSSHWLENQTVTLPLRTSLHPLLERVLMLNTSSHEHRTQTQGHSSHLTPHSHHNASTLKARQIIHSVSQICTVKVFPKPNSQWVCPPKMILFPIPIPIRQSRQASVFRSGFLPSHSTPT